MTLHGLLLASMLVSGRFASMAQNVPPLEIELIQSQAMTPGDVPSPPPADPAPPAREDAGPAVPPPPNVNIGNGPDQSRPLTVTGDNVVPPAPDSRFRNQPPFYPAEAARVGAQGTVQLMVRVSPEGVPLGVYILHSSGNLSLDREARRAVLRWHFRPALEGGRPIAFDYLQNIHYAIGDHP